MAQWAAVRYLRWQVRDGTIKSGDQSLQVTAAQVPRWSKYRVAELLDVGNLHRWICSVLERWRSTR